MWGQLPEEGQHHQWGGLVQLHRRCAGLTVRGVDGGGAWVGAGPGAGLGVGVAWMGRGLVWRRGLGGPEPMGAERGGAGPRAGPGAGRSAAGLGKG